ncbi:hypothetical protein MW887_003446 [Aspergillus wentii]|nr:hypothetical protein MW887_003446 [Aspergillus wentii]
MASITRRATGNLVHNAIDHDATGYIQKERLESRLRSLFGYMIAVRHINDRWVFEAPRQVLDYELDDLREADRVN